MKKELILLMLVNFCTSSPIYSMHKYALVEYHSDSRVLFFDEQPLENLRLKAVKIIQNEELDPEEQKRECSILLFRIIGRDPQNDYYDILESLLKNGADPDIKSGISVLYLAITTNNLNAVRLLLEHKANPNTQNSFYKQTPLMHALNMEAFGLIELLLSHGADPNISDVHGKTVLMRVFQFPGTFNLAKFRKKILYMLLYHGADVTAKDRNDMTAIDIAKRNGFTDFAEIMQIYPHADSLKNICTKYIRKNQRIFNCQLCILPLELQDAFPLEKEEKAD